MKAGNIKKDDFYAPILKTLDALGGSASNDEMNARLFEEFEFSETELNAQYKVSATPVLLNKIAWARSYLKSGGFITNETRGVWVLTEFGRERLTLSTDQIRTSLREAKHERRKSQSGTGIAKQSDAEFDREEASEENTLSWNDLLLTKMQSIDPSAFERLCQRLLRESGFTKVEVTGKSGDGGIDGQGVLRVNLLSFHVLFQCKRYLGSVGSGVIRDFRGAMQGRADKGLIITTGTFTPEARKEATRDGAPAIDLIDGETLCSLLKDQKLGVTIRQVEEVVIDDTFFDDL